MSEALVDVTYRGMEFGAQLAMSEFGPTSAFLGHSAPLPVGARLKVNTGGGIAIPIEVLRVCEQVAGADHAPGMRVRAVVLNATAITWWGEQVTRTDQTIPEPHLEYPEMDEPTVEVDKPPLLPIGNAESRLPVPSNDDNELSEMSAPFPMVNEARPPLGETGIAQPAFVADDADEKTQEVQRNDLHHDEETVEIRPEDIAALTRDETTDDLEVDETTQVVVERLDVAKVAPDHPDGKTRLMSAVTQDALLEQTRKQGEDKQSAKPKPAGKGKAGRAAVPDTSPDSPPDKPKRRRRSRKKKKP